MPQAFLDPVTSRWQEEGLFARDMDGQLVRQEERSSMITTSGFTCGSMGSTSSCRPLSR